MVFNLLGGVAMWVSFKPVKRKDILQRVARGLPGRARIYLAGEWMGVKFVAVQG